MRLFWKLLLIFFVFTALGLLLVNNSAYGNNPSNASSDFTPHFFEQEFKFRFLMLLSDECSSLGFVSGST